MKKRTLMFVLAVLVIVLAISFIVVAKHFAYQNAFQNALSNSNFLNWCQEVSANNIVLAEIYSGYGK